MFHKRVYSTAYFITKDIHLSNDVVQETFIKVFKHMDQITDSNTVGAWLSVITTRTAIDVLKKQTGHIVFPVDPAILEQSLVLEYIDTEVELLDFKQGIWDQINQLSPEHRAVIVLKYIEDMKEEDVAKQLGLTIGTVKSRLYRARGKLKKSFEKSDCIGGETL